MVNVYKNNRLLVTNQGRTDYKETWNLQKKLVRLRSLSKIPDCLIVTEHHPVVTMGRGTDPDNLLVSPEDLKEQGISLYEVERGGDITFHGPGQTVLYPIIDLKSRGRDVHKYLRDLEAVVIAALSDLNMKASIKKGLTGIWVDNHKLGAIGVAVSRWITYHGLALNVTTDLDYFELINPCGITKYPVGSVCGMSGQPIEMNQINDLLIKHFALLFAYKIEVVADLNPYLKEDMTV
jgi:lipoate-protein ligase B